MRGGRVRRAEPTQNHHAFGCHAKCNGGTPMDTASLFCVMPKPSMKSSMKTSPGWIGSILSVVVNGLHLLRSGVSAPRSRSPKR